MSPFPRWTSRALVLLVALSSALLLTSSYGAITLRPTHAADPAGRDVPIPGTGRSSVAQASPEILLRAVARGPFRPDRSRPPGRFRAGGDPEGTVPERPNAIARSLRELRLLGTATPDSGRPLAALSRGGVSRLYRPGDTIAGFTLVGVQPGAVSLASSDTTVTLRIAPNPRNSP